MPKKRSVMYNESYYLGLVNFQFVVQLNIKTSLRWEDNDN